MLNNFELAFAGPALGLINHPRLDVERLPMPVARPPGDHRTRQCLQQRPNRVLDPRIRQTINLGPKLRAHGTQRFGLPAYRVFQHLRHKMFDGAVDDVLAGSDVNVGNRDEDIGNRAFGIVVPLLAPLADQLHRLKQIALGIEIAIDHALQTLGDLVQHAFAQFPRSVENPGKLALRLGHEVIKRPNDVRIEMPNQHLNQRIPKHQLARLTHLLTHQKQRRSQAHPRCRHGRRRRQDANQIDAQTHPIQRIARLTRRQPNDVIQRINQRHDVAHHR